LRAFATTQIAFSFVLLAGSAMLVTTLLALQAENTGYDTRQVLALDIPGLTVGSDTAQERAELLGHAEGMDLHGKVVERIRELPGVEGIAGGTVVPWRDRSSMRFQFGVEGYSLAPGEESPYARPRFVGPGFFATLGIPVIAGREFTDADRRRGDRVVIVSQSIAQRLFPNGDAVNRGLWRTESGWWRRYLPLGGINEPSRIIGVVADVDDENVERQPAMTIYSLMRGRDLPDRLFVRTAGDPYALVPAVTRIIRELSANQAVENPMTLEDVRVRVLTPRRLNTFVVSGFAGIALLIAVVGVSGVLAFSVSARMREFGVRLAVGSSPRQLLLRVVSEGAFIVAIGIAAGIAVGYAMAAVASSYFADTRFPGALPVLTAAVVLGAAAVVASLMPAVRAARVDVLQALRSE
jgi:hypothetical protein